MPEVLHVVVMSVFLLEYQARVKDWIILLKPKLLKVFSQNVFLLSLLNDPQTSQVIRNYFLSTIEVVFMSYCYFTNFLGYVNENKLLQKANYLFEYVQLKSRI